MRGASDLDSPAGPPGHPRRRRLSGGGAARRGLLAPDGAREGRALAWHPGARGRGVGSALLDAVLQKHPEPLRLSAWDWRSDAMRLYLSRGFIRVPSWDERPRLICMERAVATA
ncbi:GNAT family N-acetyltransferase [Agromyces albus]|uniref:N-acetyltransferase n=1 Tax=Agromyces albus TaxID=205332 RepID=A0A4V1QYH4_9MICO|nr:N-acetyltransferase [Agromyces albus]